eukprot:GHVU01203737.1.p1 GENE.GHVU01203737.1~~GHVU01203737.1.p1  ORF type:complete len:231 (+),score=25.41 GHVU01203737.1:591-1283(+)
MQQLESDISRLSARAARSPERERSATDSLRTTVEGELTTVTSLEHNSRLLEQRIRVTEKHEKELLVCLRLMDEWETEMGRVEEVGKNLNGITEDHETLSSGLQEVEKKTAQAQRRTELLQDQLERLHSGIHRKRIAAKERHTKALERDEEELEAQAEHEKEAQQLSSIKAELLSKEADLTAEYSRSMQKGGTAYATLRTEVLHYATKHSSALQAVRAKLTSDTNAQNPED